MKYNEKMILTINGGSSSLKYKLIEMPSGRELVFGEAERVGIKTQERSCITHVCLGRKKIVSKDMPTHGDAFLSVMKLIEKDIKSKKNIKIDMLAYRYVHPGTVISKTTKLSKKLIALLKETLSLAPIHNPIIFGLIQKGLKEYPKIPQYIISDNSFHKTIPADLATYALPQKTVKKYKIKKMGFHGISHQYVMEQACKFLKRKPKEQKIISCHLGTGGASVTAIKNGRSINNSMGFTPLEGLIMNTRCGDVDLGLVLTMLFQDKTSVDTIDAFFNKKSGILGLFEDSSDLRDVVSKKDIQQKAGITFKMYIKRIRKYISFYSLILKKADILIFTDSIGVMSHVVRKKSLENMGLFGLSIDDKKNELYEQGILDISGQDSQTKILIIPTNEEKMIAKEAYKEYCHDISRRA